MASVKQGQMLEAGARAPEFRLDSLSGERSLRQLIQEGPVTLAFYKASCPVCQLAFPYLERIHRGGKARLFAISQDDAETAREFNQEFSITMPTLIDNERNGFAASNAYGITSVPSVFVVEPDGVIAQAFSGFIKKEIESLGSRFGVNPIGPGDRVPEFKAG